jgi:phosphopantetheinyl transferase (holo-ACP synthase)
VELVENLPEADDPWTHPFYQEWFRPAEIAYCLMQEQPRLHFAARWCAKEALKKCDERFLREEMSRIELVRSPSGAVSLVHHAGETARPLPYAVSITHTPLLAAAVVTAAGGASQEAAGGLPEPTITPPTAPFPDREAAPAPPAPRTSRMLGLLTLVISLAALGLALAAHLRG